MPLPVLSTYRLQLRGDAFTFADAENLLDYLDELGVSHLYLSPILTAVKGSTHGYDVTDPTTVFDELGGAEGLARLSAAARSRGMGLVVDIVPNHVGVDKPEQNRWWWDVLKHGRDSEFASYFDIDWAPDNGVDGRTALPLLGSDDDVADLTVAGDVLRLGDLVLPIAPGTGDGSGQEVHDRQHYRLIGWRRGLCGYRRFFAITSLAGLRQEDRAVFDASHVEGKRWFDEGLVDGVRIDHPDGLSDPAGYLEWLREAIGPQAWVVVEKILAVDEPLEHTLPVAGTTGYDALREIGGPIAEPVAGEPELAEPLQLVPAALAANSDPAVRIQQLCGAATAKSIEDCLFYRDARLVSLNEVGGEPERFGVSAAEVHDRAAVRARLWPQAMTTLSTHDTKRGEDVRARIGVLSQVPSLWTEFVSRWEALAPSPDPATGLFLLQNIFGVWPADGRVTDELRERLHGFAEKAIREADAHTSWNDPNRDFEAAVHGWLDSVLDGPVACELT